MGQFGMGQIPRLESWCTPSKVICFIRELRLHISAELLRWHSLLKVKQNQKYFWSEQQRALSFPHPWFSPGPRGCFQKESMMERWLPEVHLPVLSRISKRRRLSESASSHAGPRGKTIINPTHSCPSGINHRGHTMPDCKLWHYLWVGRW